MSIGQLGRRALGRYEQAASDRYRRLFLDPDHLADVIAGHATGPRILEIGCGEGLVTEALLRRLPDAHVTGIDLSPTPGRMFRGDRDRAEFLTCSAEDLLADGPGRFDLVVVCDVLHHVPDDALGSLLDAAARLCASGGVLAVKEWERNRTPGYYAGWFSDRVISGQHVRCFDHDGLLALVRRSAPTASPMGEARVQPVRSNLLVLWRVADPDQPHRRATA